MDDIQVGVDFGKGDDGTVVFYDSKEGMRILERLTLVNEGMTVVESAPTMELTRYQLEFYYKLMYRMFGGPRGTAWVRKSRRKTRRF